MSTLFSHFFTKINQISPLECKYTQGLGSIALMPKTLYFCGKMPENMVKTVAIVGSRHNTKYGEEVAYKLAYDLAREGVIIVSGLAFGIDSIAHRGCLDAGGTTIAVLGTRADEIYPRSHTALAREIIEKGGAILSEYAPLEMEDAPLGPAEAGWDGEKWVSFEKEIAPTRYKRRRIEQKLSFLYRNRLISGLADAVIVVEAAERSGTLNTATHALSQGKEVFVVPGNITSPYSRGCNKLIREGACPCLGAEDVLQVLFPERMAEKYHKAKKQGLLGDNDVETAVLGAIANGARKGEEIMGLTHLPAEVFNSAVTMLEIKGRIRALGMNNWGLV